MENNTLTERMQAEELHRQILINANMALSSWVEACKCLKKMRDTKLYTQLGYERFEDYTVQALNIKERQAYTYIQSLEKLGERFLQSNAEVGITKLSLLVSVPPDEREKIAEENDLARMSTEEVKRLVKEHDERGEQIDMLQDEIKSLNESLEAERNKPTEVAVQEPDKETLEKIKAEAVADMQKQIDAAKKEADKTVKAAKKEFSAKLEEEKKKAAEDAAAEAKKQVEEYKAKLSEVDSEKAEALERAKVLEKKLQVSASPETLKFTFYFEELKKDYDAIFDCLEKIKATDVQTADKFREAMKKYGEIIVGKLEG